MSDPRLRQFTVVRGRVATDTDLPLTVPITRSNDAAQPLLPEHREILEHCHRPQTIADLSAAVGMTIQVLRVLVLDLVHSGALTLNNTQADVEPHRNLALLEETLDAIANL
jgi:hypothetical protein